jgi:amino acid/peptide transporter (Peptide:H+ symporter), bacterial
MRAILVLFLTSTTKGGLGWTDSEALSLYGLYTMLVYVMSIPGGIIADKFLGQKKSVMLGGFLLVAGHLLLAYTEMWAFYTALGLIILGVGFLKPNISTMVGGLYRQGDSRRDAGFIIFYMGINLGAFLSSLIVGYVGEKIGWHYGFALAGFGMILGQVIFLAGQKYLKGIGDFTGKTLAEDGSAVQNVPFTKIEWDRIKVILISLVFILIFWAAFEQAGGFMNLFTKQYSDRFVTEDVRIDEYKFAASDSTKFNDIKKVIENKASPEIESFGDLLTVFLMLLLKQ